MQNKDTLLTETHNKTMRFLHEQLESTDPQMVASTMLAIAMRLYKTILTSEDFDKFVEVVLSEAGKIEPFERPRIN
jgi:hypothetical protein